VSVLAVSDANKAVLVNTRLLSLLIKVVQLYHDNAPAIFQEYKLGNSTSKAYSGGGGKDVVAATAAIEAIVQLSFHFDGDDVLKRDFITPATGVEKLFVDLLALPADRQLGDDAKAQINVLLKRLRPPPAITKMLSVLAPSLAGADSPRSSSSGGDTAPGRHIMVSYSWAAQKPLVNKFVVALRALGHDVWQDETGSSLMAGMAGSSEDVMAEAVERSHTVIICVSPQYKESANCRLEAKYAQQLFKRKQVQLLFVMMYPDYTTVSQARVVDGWLAVIVSDNLWYPLWAEDKVDGTARDITKLIGAAGRTPAGALVGSASAPGLASPASPPPAAHPPATAAAAAVGSPSGGGHETAPDYAAAWATLQDPSRVRDAEGLAALLSDQGAR
jgi:hypothetical protein